MQRRDQRHRARERVLRTLLCMPIEHDLFNCRGCSAPLGIPELAELFGETPNTLYKWSRCGPPAFPRAARKPNNKILVRCRDAHAWLEGRTQ